MSQKEELDQLFDQYQNLSRQIQELCSNNNCSVLEAIRLPEEAYVAYRELRSTQIDVSEKITNIILKK